MSNSNCGPKSLEEYDALDKGLDADFKEAIKKFYPEVDQREKGIVIHYFRQHLRRLFEAGLSNRNLRDFFIRYIAACGNGSEEHDEIVLRGVVLEIGELMHQYRSSSSLMIALQGLERVSTSFSMWATEERNRESYDCFCRALGRLCPQAFFDAKKKK